MAGLGPNELREDGQEEQRRLGVADADQEAVPDELGVLRTVGAPRAAIAADSDRRSRQARIPR